MAKKITLGADAAAVGNAEPVAGEGAAHDAPKYTPGPWAWEWISEKSNEWAVGQAWREDGTPISGQIQEGERLEDTIIERRLIGMNESGHANAADAHLIAAAPELYEALKGLVATCKCNGTGEWETSCSLCGDSTYDHICNDRTVACERPACVAARAALAKAEGQ